MAALQDMCIAGWLGSQKNFNREDLVHLLQSGSNCLFKVMLGLFYKD